MDERSIVEVQIGRPPRSPVVVEARCHLDLPVVTLVPPILDDGTPFPTSHWLTCPLAVVRIARLEAAGGVKQADARIAADAAMGRQWSETMDRYARERGARIPEDWDGPRPRGGVAGSEHGVKCLHAQYADTAAGNDNPIGRQVARDVEPLNCPVPCAVEVDGVWGANPSWTEPPRIGPQ